MHLGVSTLRFLWRRFLNFTLLRLYDLFHRLRVLHGELRNLRFRATIDCQQSYQYNKRLYCDENARKYCNGVHPIEAANTVRWVSHVIVVLESVTFIVVQLRVTVEITVERGADDVG